MIGKSQRELSLPHLNAVKYYEGKVDKSNGKTTVLPLIHETSQEQAKKRKLNRGSLASSNVNEV